MVGEVERGKGSGDSGSAVSNALGSHVIPLASLDWSVPILFYISVVAKNNK